MSIGDVFRVGVICEGPTDYVAFEAFFGAYLEHHGIQSRFLDLQPSMDRTQPEAGWGNVEKWFNENPPASRIKRFLAGGYFDFNLDAKACDVFIIHLDSDILDEPSFLSRIRQTGVVFKVNPETPDERASEIKRILMLWGNIDDCTEDEKQRHVFAPAVESTETWCVGLFIPHNERFEHLKQNDLTQKFMACLHESEGRSRQTFAHIDKDVSRRRRFCKKLRSSFKRGLRHCPSFARSAEALKNTHDVLFLDGR